MVDRFCFQLEPLYRRSLVFPAIAPLYSYSYEYSKRWRGMGADDAWG